MKEFFKKPGVLLFLGALIGAALVWISKGLSSGSWNLYAVTPSTAAIQGGRIASSSTNPSLRISILPKGHLNTMNNSEKTILTKLFTQTNTNGNSQTYIDQANRELQGIGSTLSIENNNPDPKNPPTVQAKPCQQGEFGWTLNLIFFTIRHCKQNAGL